MSKSIDLLPRTSSVTKKRFKSLDINTYWDLINYFPYRYEDYSIISTINRLQPGETVTVKGNILKTNNIYTRSGLKIQKVAVHDQTGALELIWYNQPYLIRLFKKDQTLSVAGVVEKDYGRLVMKPTSYELLKSPDQPTIHTGRIIPIYSEKKSLSSKIIREKIYNILPLKLHEFIPKQIILFNNLLDEQTSYQNIHFPENTVLAQKAKQRLAFDELFVIHLATTIIKKQWNVEKTSYQFNVGDKHLCLMNQLIDNLPFKLTSAQNKVIEEIIFDLKKDSPMNRLLQGEVGSGKTVVAAIAAYLCQLNGFQTLFMAPTEILAQQHYQTLMMLFKNSKIKITLTTGSIKPEKKELINSDIIIGTQSLIQKKIKFRKVGLVIVDEQHRFGVKQRALIKEKGINPHLLTMTATPIPRTVALTIYGELDMSIIDQMPKNRLSVKTYLVPAGKRLPSYEWIKKQILKEKTQVFIICPLIEQSEVETMKSIKAATQEFNYLKNQVFTQFSVGLLHGRIKPKDKNQIMEDFKNKKFDILVATSVVEVGIDIVNATVIVIEGAEHYGLSQLHQLRGRVGRGDKQSYCLLFTDSENKTSIERLSLFVKTADGNSLAEYDLQHRGAGQIYGTKQHGYTDLKIASLSDYNLVNKTKAAAAYFISKCNLNNYAELNNRLKQYQTNLISRD